MESDKHSLSAIFEKLHDFVMKEAFKTLHSLVFKITHTKLRREVDISPRAIHTSGTARTPYLTFIDLPDLSRLARSLPTNYMY